MKNLIIASLSTYIFYTQFCVVKIPALIPLMVLVFFMLFAEIDDIAGELRRGAHEDA